MTIDVDWFRWANVLMAGIVVLLLTAGAVARWHVMPARFRRITPWVIATYVVIAYGSGELAASSQHVDPGLRVWLLLIDLAGLLVALAWGFRATDYDE